MTSSGTTADLETYDFDFFANEILISGVFSTDAQTISISEVNRLCCYCCGGGGGCRFNVAANVHVTGSGTPRWTAQCKVWIISQMASA